MERLLSTASAGLCAALATVAFVGMPGSAAAPVGRSDEIRSGAELVTRTHIELRLRRAVASLPVSREHLRGYDRDKFGDWIDADGDCRDTRDEVLAQESRRTVEGCDITRGRWYSYYDGLSWTRSSDVDIDHLVPLAETWRSGAFGWVAAKRHAYANDLGDRRTLVAVSDNVNQSKGDDDPADWLPERAVCRYVREYTAVKLRWLMTVDRREKHALSGLAADCPNRIIRVRPRAD